MIRDRRNAVAASLFLLVVLLLNLWRLTLGVDFTDESFYAATSYRFLLGDVPFRDDLSIVQIAPAIGAFLVKITSPLFPEPITEGLVLKLRLLSFLLSALCALGVIRSVRGALEHRLVLAAIPLSFSAINIFGFSYNNVACSLLFLTVLGCAAGLRDRRRLLLILSGFCYAVTCAVYPTFSFAAPAYVGILLWFASPGFRMSAAASTFAGFAGATLTVLAILNFPSPADVARALEFTNATYVDPTPIYYTAWDNFYEGLHTRIIRLGLIGVIAIATYAKIRKRDPMKALIPFLDFYIVAILIQALVHSANNERTLLVALFTFLSLRVIISLRLSDRITNFVMALGLLFGLTFGITSGNGIMNFALGSVATVVWLLAMLINQRISYRPINHTNIYLNVAIVSVLALLVFKFDRFYRERPLPELTHEVEAGAFAGLKVSEAKKQFIEDLTETIKPLESSYSSIFIYDKVPAAYLLTQLKPATDNTWICMPFFFCTMESRLWYTKRLAANKDRTLVVEIQAHETFTYDILDLSFYDQDTLRAFVRANFQNKLAENPRYTVYSAKDSSL